MQNGRMVFHQGMWPLSAKIGCLFIACLTVTLCYLNTSILLQPRILAFVQVSPGSGTGSSSATAVLLLGYVTLTKEITYSALIFRLRLAVLSGLPKESKFMVRGPRG